MGAPGFASLSVPIFVKPHASSTEVAGTHDGALVVRVTEAPESGRATKAALVALAKALGLSSSQVRLVRGATSRHKLVDLSLDPSALDDVRQRLEALRAAS